MIITINKHHQWVGKSRTRLGRRPTARDIERRIDAELCAKHRAGHGESGMHLGAAGHHYCMHVTMGVNPNFDKPAEAARLTFDVEIANPPGPPVLTTSLLGGVVSLDGRGGPW